MKLKELSDRIEQVSRLYSDKYGIHRDDDWYVFKLQEELGELVQRYLMLTDRGRQKGFSKEEIRCDFEDEVADTFSTLLMLIRHFDVDLERALERKWFRHLEGEKEE